VKEEILEINLYLGSGHYLWWGVALFFFVKLLLIQSNIKKSKTISPNLEYQLKNKYPPTGQKLYKRIPFGCHTCPLPLL
jgi:hypothetical protein